MGIILGLVGSSVNAHADIYQVDGYYRGATYIRTLYNDDGTEVRILKCDVGNEDASCRDLRTNAEMSTSTRYTIQNLTQEYQSLKSDTRWHWVAAVGTVAANLLTAGFTSVATVSLASAIPMTTTSVINGYLTTKKAYAYLDAKAAKEIGNAIEATKAQKSDWLDTVTPARMAETLESIIQGKDAVTTDLDQLIARLSAVLDEASQR